MRLPLVRSVCVLLGILCPSCTLLVDASGLSSGATDTPDAGVRLDEAGAGDDAPRPAPPDGGEGSTELDSFADDFERADDESIGNGWIEKTPTSFFLQAGEVVKRTTVPSYQDNMVYRPADEDRADVETAMAFRLASSGVHYPQVFVRAQRASIELPDQYDGYILYVAGAATEAVLGRQRGTPFVVTLSTIAIAPPLDASSRHRLRLSARGADPVVLDAWIERLEGATWTVLGEAHTTDAKPERVTGAGAVGFSANEKDGPFYDDFSWRALDPP